MSGAPRFYDLSAARPEGWFDEVLQQSPDFERACQIIGRNTLALALVAGTRIASLTPSQRSQNQTIVEFSIGANVTRRELPLPEFRDAVAQLLLAPLKGAGLPAEPDVEALQAHIGSRYMLEAALFEVRPLELRCDLGLSEVVLEFNGVRHTLSLEDFRDVIDERVRAELGLGQAGDELAIDLVLVDRAEEANRQEEWVATVTMLTPWLTPISMLLRSGESSQLDKKAHARVSEALDLLGTAYAHMGDLDAANEVLRLGVQWAGESDKAGDLYFTLGRASVTSGKHGEAIGLLRRAVRLGAREGPAMSLLAQSLAAREQGLAAIVCLERARELGANTDDQEGLEASLQARFGDAWPRFRRWVDDAE